MPFFFEDVSSGMPIGKAQERKKRPWAIALEGDYTVILKTRKKLKPGEATAAAVPADEAAAAAVPAAAPVTAAAIDDEAPTADCAVHADRSSEPSIPAPSSGAAPLEAPAAQLEASPATPLDDCAIGTRRGRPRRPNRKVPADSRENENRPRAAIAAALPAAASRPRPANARFNDAPRRSMPSMKNVLSNSFIVYRAQITSKKFGQQLQMKNFIFWRFTAAVGVVG